MTKNNYWSLRFENNFYKFDRGSFNENIIFNYLSSDKVLSQNKKKNERIRKL